MQQRTSADVDEERCVSGRWLASLGDIVAA